MKHPWEYLIQEIRDRGWTQKQFSLLLWKKVSEVNELIKWKRNITIQRDLLLSNILWSPEKYWMNKQIDHDYSIAKRNFDSSKLGKQEQIKSPQIPQRPIPPKAQEKIEQTIKSPQKITPHKKNEGIFRNF